jgi:hypothetical protein
MDRGPGIDERLVVLVPAQSARPVPGRERRGLVQEEELGEATRLHQSTAMPPSEGQLARDPPLAAVRTSDASVHVVHVAAVRVDEPTCRHGDRLPQRRHPIPQRHEVTL